jgi:phenylalanyl-tRNA synthetase alpha subunit
MSTDLLAENDRLEAQVLAAIAGAQDEAALEVVRIGALGKKGSISAMLATLGKMSPDERRTRGVEINALKDKRRSRRALRPRQWTSRCRFAPAACNSDAFIRSAR